jgi:hypothetical protein
MLERFYDLQWLTEQYLVSGSSQNRESRDHGHPREVLKRSAGTSIRDIETGIGCSLRTSF